MIEDGLLWFDDSKTRPLEEKVRQAMARYQVKYGHKPNVCYVHTDCLGQVVAVDDVKVLGAKSVLPNHFWLGMESKDVTKRKSSKSR